MTLHHSAGAQKTGAAETERRLTEIVLLMRKVFPTLRWNQATLPSPGKNDLTIEIDRRRGVVRFTDRELRSHSRVLRVRALDHRMYAAVTKLFDA